MNCTFRRIDARGERYRHRCVRCGRETSWSPHADSGMCHAPCRRTTRGLGDWLAWLLAAIGITKRRAQVVARAIGKENCGCAERQERLNEVGERLLAALPPLSGPESPSESPSIGRNSQKPQ